MSSRRCPTGRHHHDGTIKTALYSTDGTLSAWVDLGGNVTGVPAAFINQGYRTGVVARAADGALVMKKQELGGAWPATWQTVGTFTAAGSPAAIVDPALSRIAVVARAPTTRCTGCTRPSRARAPLVSGCVCT